MHIFEMMQNQIAKFNWNWEMNLKWEAWLFWSGTTNSKVSFTNHLSFMIAVIQLMQQSWIPVQYAINPATYEADKKL